MSNKQLRAIRWLTILFSLLLAVGWLWVATLIKKSWPLPNLITLFVFFTPIGWVVGLAHRVCVRFADPDDVLHGHVSYKGVEVQERFSRQRGFLGTEIHETILCLASANRQTEIRVTLILPPKGAPAWSLPKLEVLTTVPLTREENVAVVEWVRRRCVLLGALASVNKREGRRS